MISYCEAEGKDKFDWDNFILKIVNSPESISVKEHKNVILLAESWSTCPIGCQPNIIERDYRGAPTDVELIECGKSFYDAIKDWNGDYTGDILRTYTRIKERSQSIVNEIILKYVEFIESAGYKVTKNTQ